MICCKILVGSNYWVLFVIEFGTVVVIIVRIELVGCLIVHCVVALRTFFRLSIVSR